MDSIFKQLFQYGFHDTEISSIDCEGLEVKLNFDKGIYLLDENGKETILSKPMQVILILLKKLLKSKNMEKK